jgi:phage baseplate assembly protein gpV
LRAARTVSVKQLDSFVKIDSTVAPTNKRIAGTLHARGNTHPAPSSGENQSREKAAEDEVAGQHKNSGEKEQKGER